MGRRLTIKNHLKEIALFNHRIIAVVVLTLAMTGILAGRLYYLQVMQHQLYTTLSEQNQVMLLPVDPSRGLIYDRNGVLLAQNLPTYSLEIMPDKVLNAKSMIRSLKKYIDITENDLAKFHKLLKQRRRFESVPIKMKLTEDEVATFYVNQFLFPGVFVKAELMRHYPFYDGMVDSLGYVGRINEKELTEIDQKNYIATNYIGKLGIEKFYENVLHGTVGNQQVEVDASGKIVRTLKINPPIPGDDLYLTLDSKLQMVAKGALSGYRGSLVAIQPATGEVLALVSNPTYDPNLFVQGISNTDYQNLRKDRAQPLNNRSIRGQYPFASAIKPFYALQGLQTGIANTKFSISDPGWYQIPTGVHIYKDWKKGGHGTVNIEKAVTVSCDTYFYQLAFKMGIEKMADILHQFGFGKDPGIDLPDTLPGVVATPAWKMSAYGAKWYQGDTIVAGIGQGYMLTTPLLLANGIATIANRGKRFQLHLLKKQQAPDKTITEKLPIELTPVNVAPENFGYIIKAMQAVIAPGGTGGRYGDRPYTAAAKTGTGQVAKLETVKQYGNKSNIPEYLRDNSMFIIFAPVENPQIAVAVVLENNHDALEVARTVLDYYLMESTHVNTTTNEPLIFKQ